jgi:methylated-DNA-[protein]-cysteine S-methyltransferase
MGEMELSAQMNSPIGPLLLTGDGHALTGLYMGREPSGARDDSAFTHAREQLDAYFAGALERFDIALAPRGTEFQRRVWDALLEIPYGATTSYGALAAKIGRPDAARAVGLANGRNPISIIVPCHRVIGAAGALTGYGGGLERKRWLLAHERGQGELVP